MEKERKQKTNKPNRRMIDEKAGEKDCERDA